MAGTAMGTIGVVGKATRATATVTTGTATAVTATGIASIASCAATRFMGGGLDEMMLGTLAGAMLGTLSLVLNQRASWGKMVQPLGAMLVAFTATTGATLFHAVDVDKALLGGLIVLVPGFTIAIAVRELVSGHTVAGIGIHVGHGILSAWAGPFS